jgi:hypothetical protein
MRGDAGRALLDAGAEVGARLGGAHDRLERRDCRRAGSRTRM